MPYTLSYTVKDEHIDFQDIMDGLYYPFYMEDCRHRFVREVMGFDIEEQAKAGVNIVLSGYTIRFVRSLKKGDRFEVTCALYRDPSSTTRLHIKQEITINNKLYSEATFTATCVPASGGRPFLPEALTGLLNEAPVLE